MRNGGGDGDDLHCGGGTEEFHQKPKSLTRPGTIVQCCTVFRCVQYSDHVTVMCHITTTAEQNMTEELRDITILQQRDSFSVVPCSVFPPATTLVLAVMSAIVRCVTGVWR